MDEVAIITIGSELVEGLRMDTNGPGIARLLEQAGFRIRSLISVGDDPVSLERILGTACRRYPLVITTGGLGPTHDDVTRECAARALGIPLEVDPGLVEVLERRVGTVSDTAIHAELLRQADVLAGARVLPAITGTAPGQEVPTPAGRLVLLPGPPLECMPILRAWLGEGQGSDPARIDLGLYGKTESEVQHLVLDALAGRPGIEFTVLASPAAVHVLLTDRGAGREGFEQGVEDVRHALGDLVFADDGSSLAEVVVRGAIARGVTMATAESCTGGLIAGAITSVAGSSEVFPGGIVSYANEVKVSELGVDAATLASRGAVSREVAIQMAEGVRARLKTTLAVSVTGVAGPGGGTAEKPVGTVWMAVATPEGTHTFLAHRGGTRDAIRTRTVSRALDLLRRALLGLPLPTEEDTVR